MRVFRVWCRGSCPAGAVDLVARITGFNCRGSDNNFRSCFKCLGSADKILIKVLGVVVNVWYVSALCERLMTPYLTI